MEKKTAQTVDGSKTIVHLIFMHSHCGHDAVASTVEIQETEMPLKRLAGQCGVAWARCADCRYALSSVEYKQRKFVV